MSIRVDATYENGVLKLNAPLPLAEHEQVRITVERARTWTERTAGILQWTGTAEELERLALEPPCDAQETA